MKWPWKRTTIEVIKMDVKRYNIGTVDIITVCVDIKNQETIHKFSKKLFEAFKNVKNCPKIIVTNKPIIITGEKNKPTGKKPIPGKITKKKVLRAIPGSNGSFNTIAARCEVNRKSLYKWFKKNPEIEKKRIQEKNR